MFPDGDEERGVQIDVEGEIENHISWSANIFKRSAQVLQDEVSGDQGIPAEVGQAFNAPGDSFGR